MTASLIRHELRSFRFYGIGFCYYAGRPALISDPAKWASHSTGVFTMEIPLWKARAKAGGRIDSQNAVTLRWLHGLRGLKSLSK
jgi:hypothetical protein